MDVIIVFCKDKKNVIDSDVLQNEIHALREVPKSLIVADKLHEKCRRLSKRYLHGHGFFSL